MKINAPFLILNQSIEPNRETIIIVPGGELVDAFILDARADYMVIEVMGVPFEARPWMMGDKLHPLYPHTSPGASAWTVYAVEGAVDDSN